MLKKTIHKTNEQLLAENGELSARLAEAKETLDAIRSGEVDAIVVSGSEGEQIYSISSAETPYRLFIEEMNEGAVTISGEGVILYCNHRFADIIREPVEHVIGSSFDRIIAAGDLPKFDFLLHQGPSVRSDALMTTSMNRDNEIIYLQLSFSHLPLSIYGVICIIATDISALIKKEKELLEIHGFLKRRMKELVESRILSMKMLEDAVEAKNNIAITNKKLVNEIADREQVEEERKRIEEHFRTIFEQSPIGIGLVDSLTGRIFEVNERFAQIAGRTREEMTTIDWMHITHPDDVLEVMDHMAQLNAGVIDGFQLNKRYLRPDGSVVYVSMTIAPIQVEDKTQPRHLSLVEDITGRMEAEQALKKSELKYSIVADNTYDWEFWSGADGTYIYHSPSCKRITGYSAGDFIKDPETIVRIIHPDDKIVFAQHEHSAQKNRIPATAEFRIVAANGKTKWIEHICQPVFDVGGVFLGTRGSNKDITDRKQAEDAVKINESRLRELNATRDKFFSIIAHDLKSPFNAILGFSNMLAEQISENNYSGIREYARIMQKSSQRAMDLLSNLLEWARLQTGKLEFNPRNIEIVELIREAVEISDESAVQKSITLKTEIPQTMTVFADHAMISSILRNLISNSIKFTNPGGWILISAEPHVENLILSVCDNGVGISENCIQKLFRIDEICSTTGTQKETGTGLGLMLCKEFVEKHGGKIWVESEVGKGSMFHFSIPLANTRTSSP